MLGFTRMIKHLRRDGHLFSLGLLLGLLIVLGRPADVEALSPVFPEWWVVSETESGFMAFPKQIPVGHEAEDVEEPLIPVCFFKSLWKPSDAAGKTFVRRQNWWAEIGNLSVNGLRREDVGPNIFCLSCPREYPSRSLADVFYGAKVRIVSYSSSDSLLQFLPNRSQNPGPLYIVSQGYALCGSLSRLFRSIGCKFGNCTLMLNGLEGEYGNNHVHCSQVDHNPRWGRKTFLGVLLIVLGICVCVWSAEGLCGASSLIRARRRWPFYLGVSLSFALLIMGQGLCLMGKPWP